jgi:heat shock protein HslJ
MNKYIPLIIAGTVILSVAIFTGCTSDPIAQKQSTSANIKAETHDVTLNSNEQLLATWQVESITNRPVIDSSPAQLIFLDKFKFSGSASCNNISSSYKLSDKQQIQIRSPFAMTQKMCPPALMDQEKRFVTAIEKVQHYQIKQGLLYLFDKNGEIVFKASKVDK